MPARESLVFRPVGNGCERPRAVAWIAGVELEGDFWVEGAERLTGASEVLVERCGWGIPCCGRWMRGLWKRVLGRWKVVREMMGGVWDIVAGKRGSPYGDDDDEDE